MGGGGGVKSRKIVRIPKISNKMRDGDVESDWVTMGVVVDKLPPRWGGGGGGGKSRKIVRIPKISNKMRDGDVESDWVTMGVVVDKLPPR